MDISSFMTNDNIKKMKDIFEDFDDDLDGNIELTVLEAAIRSFGLNPTGEEMKIVLHDMRNYDLCNFNQYAYFVYHISRYANTKADLISAFRVFDKNSTGKIKAIHAQKILSNIEYPLPNVQINKIFEKLGIDNGFIDYKKLVDVLLFA